MKRRYKLTRSFASAATLLSAGGLAGFQLAVAPSADAVVAAPITSTWTGGGTASNDTGPAADGSDWTDAANWSTTSPDVVPLAGDTVSTLTFPELTSCDSEFQSTGTNSTSCYNSNNDLSSLTVGSLDIHNPTSSTYTDPVSGNPSYSPGYYIGGNPITLTGGISVTGSDMDHSPGLFGIPLTLSSSSQTWALPGSQTDFTQNVTGASTDLTVQASSVGTSPATGSTAMELDGQVETKSFTFAGQDTGQTGSNAMMNGTLMLGGADVNGSNSTAGTSGNPLTVTNAALTGAGTVGALSVTGGYVNVQDVNTYGPVVLAAGGVTLDSTSALNFDVNGAATTSATPGTDYSQLTASNGTVDLGSAVLDLAGSNMSGQWATCADPLPGTVYTLVTAKSLTGTVSFDDNGAGTAAAVPSGGIVSMPSCDNSTNDQFRIDYTSTALTATALAPTTTTVNVASSSPQVNQPDAVTATVTSTSAGTPDGTVDFTADTENASVPACSSVPVVNGQATCNVTFDNSGLWGISTTYTPTNGSGFAPSYGGTTSAINVQPISGASSSDSSTASGSTTTATATNPDNGVSATASGGNGTVTTSNYTSDPVSAPTFDSNGTYFDVQISSGSTFTSASIAVPNVPAGGSVYWYNPTGGWTKVVGDTGSTQSPFVAVIDSASSPKISQLQGTVFAVAGTGVAPAGGYDLAASDGGVFTFGDAGFYKSMGGQHLNAPIVGMASTPSHKGYWLVASDGGVFTFGDAGFYKSMGGQHLNAPIVGMAATSDGKGYWLVASDGGVFSFGDAVFHGSAVPYHPVKPVVGIASADNGGYWLVGADGGVFSFGDAVFHGSAAPYHPVKPVVGIASADKGGYWLVGADGGVFSFGDAAFHGSAVPYHPTKPIVGIASHGSGGYWLVGSDGGVFSFGDAGFFKSMGGQHLNAPVVGMAGA